MTRPDDIISASEIGQWVYCQRAWWLARRGEANRNAQALRRGEQQHRQHSRQVARSARLRWLALIVIGLASLLFLWVGANLLLK